MKKYWLVYLLKYIQREGVREGGGGKDDMIIGLDLKTYLHPPLLAISAVPVG